MLTRETIGNKEYNVVCSVSGCGKPIKCKGLCSTHYMRLLRTGSTDDTDMAMPIKERLVNRTKVDDNNCWNYTRSKGNKGYGDIWYRGKKYKAHRLSYELFVGQIPSDQIVRHKCDNPSCLNPEHLELGTNRDNINDMIKRGRSPCGEQKASAKLTANQVVDMRYKNCFDGRNYRSLALEYNVHHRTVADIISGRWWKHLPYGENLTYNNQRIDDFAIEENER